MADSLLFRAVEEIRRMGDPEYWEKELNIMQAGEEGRHMWLILYSHEIKC